MAALSTLQIIDTVDHYASTNFGTGPGDPFTTYLTLNNVQGSGESNESFEDSVQNAYKDLIRNSTL